MRVLADFETGERSFFTYRLVTSDPVLCFCVLSSVIFLQILPYLLIIAHILSAFEKFKLCM